MTMSSDFRNVTPCNKFKAIDVSAKHILSIFRVKDQVKQEILICFHRTTRCYVPEDISPHVLKTFYAKECLLLCIEVNI
jgi:hypothetical protein